MASSHKSGSRENTSHTFSHLLIDQHEEPAAISTGCRSMYFVIGKLVLSFWLKLNPHLFLSHEFRGTLALVKINLSNWDFIMMWSTNEPRLKMRRENSPITVTRPVPSALKSLVRVRARDPTNIRIWPPTVPVAVAKWMLGTAVIMKMKHLPVLTKLLQRTIMNSLNCINRCSDKSQSLHSIVL